MASDEKPRLTLIRGGGETTSAVPRSFVALDAISNVRAAPAQQELGAASSPRSRIISLGLDGLEFHEFYRILKIAGVRSIVDTRILAAFRGNGFMPHLVTDLFEELRVDYQRVSVLQNPFSAGEIGVAAALERYVDHLRGLTDVLGALGRRMERGPLLLLGRAVEHAGSEREAIITEMTRLGISLELVVVQKRENAVHMMSWHGAEARRDTEARPVTAAQMEHETIPPRKPSRKPRTFNASGSDAQGVFPFIVSTSGERK